MGSGAGGETAGGPGGSSAIGDPPHDAAVSIAAKPAAVLHRGMMPRARATTPERDRDIFMTIGM
jgi:hypothetical protein